MHRLGDVVEVRLVEAAPVAGALRFELLSEGQVVPRGRKARPRRRPRERPQTSAPRPRPIRAAARARRRASRAKRKARQSEERASHGNREATDDQNLDPGYAISRKARPMDRDEARLSRPLPALRRRQTVSRLPQGRRQLLGVRTGFHAAPRRRPARLSRHRHRRPHRGAAGVADRDQLFAAGGAAARDLFAV